MSWHPALSLEIAHEFASFSVSQQDAVDFELLRRREIERAHQRAWQRTPGRRGWYRDYVRRRCAEDPDFHQRRKDAAARWRVRNRPQRAGRRGQDTSDAVA